MQRVINESVCDRCGKVFSTERDWEYRGASRIGKIYTLIPRLLDYFKDRDFNVSVRLYYVSHYSICDDKIVDLCDECKEELATWFNAPTSERGA